jgi:hypothetical protein
MKTIHLIFSFLIVACSPAKVVSKVKDSGLSRSDVGLTISITRNVSKPEWTANFYFNKPIDAFFFVTPFEKRETTWSIKQSDHIEFVAGQNGQTVAAKDGAKFQEITFDFDSFYSDDLIPQFMSLSGSSLAISTTILTGYEYRESSSDYLELTTTFKLKPRRGEIVASDTGVSHEELRYDLAPRSFGTYLYFGDIEPITVNGTRYIVDPRVGSASRDLAIRTESEALALLTQNLGELPFKPMILLRQSPIQSADVDAGGSAYWGLFQAAFLGDGKSLNSQEKSRIQNVLIHETSHLWAGALYQSWFDPSFKTPLFKDIPESIYDQWIFEGGAEALAIEVRKSLKYETDSTYDAIKSKALVDCKSVIGTKRVIDRPKDEWMFMAPYKCGESLQFLIVDVIAKHSPDYSIYNLWKDLFTAARDKNIDNAVFFAAVKNAAPRLRNEDIDLIKSFLVSPADKIDDIVKKVRDIP